MPRRVLPQAVIDRYLAEVEKPARRERVPIALTEARVRKLSMYPNMTSDGGCMGLWVRTSPRLTQSYCFRYQWRGKRHEMGLGPTEVVSLQEARAMVLAARHLMVVENKDPLIQRRKAWAEETRASVTFGDVLTSYLDIHSAKWSRQQRLSAEWQNSLSTHTPSLIAMSIQDVDTDAIVKALRPLWTVKSVKLGERLRYRIEAVLGFAQSSGLRGNEPNPARKRHHLANLLPAIERHAEKARYESLPYQEIAPLMHQLETVPGSVAACLRFLILTGVRTSEARLAAWSEIDLANKVWTIPSARMKVGKEYKVPLSPQALAILEQQRGKHPVAVFPGRRGAQGPSEGALIQLLKRTGCDATVHGFRASLKTWASEESDYPKEVIESCLAHAIGNQVEQAYQRGTFFSKRVGLMSTWGAHVTAGG